MSNRESSHIHRYKKVRLGGSKENPYYVYKCVKAGCSHYTPLALAEGTLSECNRCHEPMIMGKIQLNGSGGRPMAKPHCSNCIKTKKKEEVASIEDFLKEKGA